jgi:hypothetical protein
MKKQFISILIFVLIAFASAAQDSVATMVSRNRYVNFDFAIGYLHTDLSNINGFLSSYGYKPLQDDIITLSLGTAFSVNRFIFRPEFTWQFPVTRHEAENVTSTFSGRHVAVSVGYLLIQKPGFRLFPYVGLDAFSSRLVVRENTPVANVDDLVDHKQRGFYLAYSNAALDFGFQVDKMISLKNKRWDCPQNAKYMTLGLRVGYLLGPGTVYGRFNGQTVEGAPSYSPNGPYIKLVIGFSTKIRDMKWKK